jgi:hypothetical protein
MSQAAQQVLVERAGVEGNCLTAVTVVSDGLSADAVEALSAIEITDISGDESDSAVADVALTRAGAEQGHDQNRTVMQHDDVAGHVRT